MPYPCPSGNGQMGHSARFDEYSVGLSQIHLRHAAALLHGNPDWQRRRGDVKERQVRLFLQQFAVELSKDASRSLLTT